MTPSVYGSQTGVQPSSNCLPAAAPAAAGAAAAVAILTVPNKSSCNKKTKYLSPHQNPQSLPHQTLTNHQNPQTLKTFKTLKPSKHQNPQNIKTLKPSNPKTLTLMRLLVFVATAPVWHYRNRPTIAPAAAAAATVATTAAAGGWWRCLSQNCYG